MTECLLFSLMECLYEGGFFLLRECLLLKFGTKAWFTIIYDARAYVAP